MSARSYVVTNPAWVSLRYVALPHVLFPISLDPPLCLPPPAGHPVSIGARGAPGLSGIAVFRQCLQSPRALALRLSAWARNLRYSLRSWAWFLACSCSTRSCRFASTWGWSALARYLGGCSFGITFERGLLTVGFRWGSSKVSTMSVSSIRRCGRLLPSLALPFRWSGPVGFLGYLSHLRYPGISRHFPSSGSPP